MKTSAAAAIALSLLVTGTARAGTVSVVKSVRIASSEPVGTFGGIAFHRLQGTIEGEAAVSEQVVGLRDAAMGRDAVPYQAAFDLILPDDPAQAGGVVVEANNRGMPVLATSLSAPGSIVLTPSGGKGSPAGDGFLPQQRLSLARVQWQVGKATGVPDNAQGVGQVIMRDFGRWLAGEFPGDRAGVPVFRHRIIAGVSQSAWFVNAFIAEGFNVDPATGRGVFQGAFTRNGAGNVLALNRFAAGKAQFPYFQPQGVPLTPAQLLTRPASDPVVVDVTSLTDYYRVRASVFARASGKAGLHRYATMAAHGPGGVLPDALFFGKMQCNGGKPMAVSEVRDTFALRALVTGLAAEIGAAPATPLALPADAPFRLRPASARDSHLNRLEKTALWVPATARGVPLGGVRVLDAALPLGAPEPPAIEPVAVRTIDDICGNFGGWQAFGAEELRRRYGSRAALLARARRQAQALVRAGFLLRQDAPAAVAVYAASIPPAFR